MVKKRRILIVLFILPIFGCIFGAIFNDWSSSTLRIKWQPLGKPQSLPIEILQASPLLLLGSDGNNYSYSSKKWEITDTEPDPLEESKFDYLCEGIEIRDIENLVDSSDSCYPWGLGYSYKKYVLLEDGSVWKWDHHHGGEGSMAFFLIPLIGSAIFLVIAIIIMLIFLFDDLLNSLQEKAKQGDN